MHTVKSNKAMWFVVHSNIPAVSEITAYKRTHAHAQSELQINNIHCIMSAQLAV